MSEVFTPDYKPINKFDSIAFKLWKQVYDYRMSKKIRPITLGKSKVKSWTNEIRIMIEKDERSENEIDEVLSFIQTDDFWAKIILSPSKLRRHFETLLSEARTIKVKKPMRNIFSIGNDQNLSDTMNYNTPFR